MCLNPNPCSQTGGSKTPSDLIDVTCPLSGYHGSNGVIWCVVLCICTSTSPPASSTEQKMMTPAWVWEKNRFKRQHWIYIAQKNLTKGSGFIWKLINAPGHEVRVHKSDNVGLAEWGEERSDNLSGECLKRLHRSLNCSTTKPISTSPCSCFPAFILAACLRSRTMSPAVGVLLLALMSFCSADCKSLRTAGSHTEDWHLGGTYLDERTPEDFHRLETETKGTFRRVTDKAAGVRR